MEPVKLTVAVTLTYDTDIGGDHEGEADGQTEGDGAAHHVQLRGEQTPPTHRALPAPTRHQYPLINVIVPRWAKWIVFAIELNLLLPCFRLSSSVIRLRSTAVHKACPFMVIVGSFLNEDALLPSPFPIYIYLHHYQFLLQTSSNKNKMRKYGEKKRGKGKCRFFFLAFLCVGRLATFSECCGQRIYIC